MKLILLIIMIAFPVPLIASNEYKKTEITQTINKESQSITQNAQRWGLSDDEYIRYMEIIKGPLGHWNANIDPILALGIYAENEIDKKRYAELYAKQEYTLTIKTQDFQRLYQSTFNRLYPNANVVESAYLQNYYKYQAKSNGDNPFLETINGTPLKAGDRFLYFPSIGCLDCKKNIKGFYEILKYNPNIYLDIYLVGSKNEDEVRKWAAEMSINIDFVLESKITLNVDGGLLKKLQKDDQTDAIIYLNRGDDIFKIDPKQINL